MYTCLFGRQIFFKVLEVPQKHVLHRHPLHEAGKWSGALTNGETSWVLRVRETFRKAQGRRSPGMKGRNSPPGQSGVGQWDGGTEKEVGEKAEGGCLMERTASNQQKPGEAGAH